MNVLANGQRRAPRAAAPERGEDEGYAVGTVHRAVSMLAALADAGGPVRISELAQRVHLAPSTTHRLLHLLMNEGLVQWSAKTHSYSIGAELYRIASRVVSNVGIGDLALGHLQRLAQQFGETALLGLYVPLHPALSFVARADGPHALQYRLPMNQPLSLLRGASGKSVLAFLPEAVSDRAFRVDALFSTTNITPMPSRQLLAQSLRRIRKDGYAITEGDRLPGAQGVAVPIFDAKGVAGCICITAPKSRVNKTLVQSMLRETLREAAALSEVLGAREAQSQLADSGS